MACHTPPHPAHLLARLAALLLAISIAHAAQAQSDAVVAQYYETPTLYNPAMAGATDRARARAGARMQWAGVSNAPKAYALLADSPFRLGQYRMGAGIAVLKETYGLYSSLQASAQLAARLQLPRGQLSVALQAGLYSQRFNGSDIYLPGDDDGLQETDPGLPTTDISGQALDLGLGIAYHTHAWYAALSCLHLTGPSVSLSEPSGANGSADVTYQFQAKRTVYFQAGCNIEVKNTLFEVMPSVIAASDFTFYTGIASVRVRYNSMFSAGIGYRYKEGAVFSLGAEFKNFYLGYSYEHSTSAIGRSSSGSHEAWLGYSMKVDLSAKTRHRHRSVRYM